MVPSLAFVGGLVVDSRRSLFHFADPKFGIYSFFGIFLLFATLRKIAITRACFSRFSANSEGSKNVMHHVVSPTFVHINWIKNMGASYMRFLKKMPNSRDRHGFFLSMPQGKPLEVMT